MQEIATSQADVDVKDAKVSAHDAELESLAAKHRAVERSKAQLAKVELKQAMELTKAEQMPEKAKKQVEHVAMLHAQVTRQHAVTSDRLDQAESELQERQQSVRRMEDEHLLLMGDVERHSYEVEAREQSIDNMQKEVAMKQLEAEQILGQQVRAEDVAVGATNHFAPGMCAGECALASDCHKGMRSPKTTNHTSSELVLLGTVSSRAKLLRPAIFPQSEPPPKTAASRPGTNAAPEARTTLLKAGFGCRQSWRCSSR